MPPPRRVVPKQEKAEGALTSEEVDKSKEPVPPKEATEPAQKPQTCMPFIY
jgi:hypothetical protein